MNSGQRARWMLGGVLTLLCGLAAWWALRGEPQIERNEEVLRTLDGLFTAVTGRNEQALAQCEARLVTAKSQGNLPAAAARRLDGVIARARAGGWEDASRDLYGFIRAQRGH